jgi:hypothetical protein
MFLKKVLVILLLPTLPGACVSFPTSQEPIAFSKTESYELFRSPLLDQTNHTIQHLNKNKDIVYYQTYGGGGVGLGLLGPFGVAANIKMIKSKTMKDVELLRNKILVDPQVIFKNVALKNGYKSSSGSSRIKLSPYILVERTEGERLKIASVIIANIEGDTAKLPKKYLVQLPIDYSVKELSQLNNTSLIKLKRYVREGFKQLLIRMSLEGAAEIDAEQKILVKSEFLTPRFKFEMKGRLIEKSNGITWVRIIGCVCGVQDSDLEYKISKK